MQENKMISIHSPHARGDHDFRYISFNSADFNPLPSCEGRLNLILQALGEDEISIHSPHARGDVLVVYVHNLSFISIHSPHARGDNRGLVDLGRNKISIHSPHARGDLSAWRLFEHEKFQSTPLMRGETIKRGVGRGTSRFQSTPLMRGETFCNKKF